MGNFDDERLKYRDMVGKQGEAITQLLELSDTHSGLFESDTVRQLTACKEKCDKLYRKLDKNEFEIAIVGVEKAGKSTFGNALMKNHILPDADERCTYTSTCIRYGSDRAVVKFFTAAEMDNVLRSYLDVMGIPNVESYTYLTMSVNQYNTLFNKLEDKTRSYHENSTHQDVLNLLENKDTISNLLGSRDRFFEGEELSSNEFRCFIVDPKVAVAVKEVSIESSQLGDMQNAVIYDVPGFDSPTSMHLEQTKKRMKEADAIILVASAERPSFTGPALKMFRDVVDEDNVSLSDKLFIFGNRADGATTLGKNIQTIKDDAIKWNLLSRSLLDERIMVGSAKAHLQQLGLVPGSDLPEKLESEEYKAAWKYGDGIDYTYSKLVAYNESNRFPILRNKVLHNNEELRTIIGALNDKYSSVGAHPNYTALIQSSSDLTRTARETITNRLESMRKEIRDKYSAEACLSEKLKEEIDKLFEDGKYEITDEEIRAVDLKNDGVGRGINIEASDEMIRINKFSEIYAELSYSAFSVAQNDHSEYYHQTIKCFEEALNISAKIADHDKIHELVGEFVNKYRTDIEDEFIYQPLIERFVRDVVEVLIRYPYSSEARCRKFVDEAEVFSGLVLFYDPDDGDENYKRRFLSVAPKNQPLLLSLLFHDYKEAAEAGESAFSHINSICKDLCDNPEIIQLIFSIIKLDPLDSVDAIKKLTGEDNFKKREIVDARSIAQSLREMRDNLTKSSKTEDNSSTRKFNFDFTNKDTFMGQYKQYFGDTSMREYEDLREFFKIDLEILRKFLIHASVPAIRLEKPFVAREVQSINKLLDAVSSKEFDDLIAANSNLLLPGESEKIDREYANMLANKQALAEVNKIMATLN